MLTNNIQAAFNTINGNNTYVLKTDNTALGFFTDMLSDYKIYTLENVLLCLWRTDREVTMITLLEFALQNLLFIGLHLDSRSSFPKQLTQQEEEECIEKIAQGDMEARSRLIEHNLRLVAYIVNKNYPEHTRGSQQDADDLISIGTIGLIRAAETFDYSKGSRFSTYASRCIDNAITNQRKQFFSRSTGVFLWSGFSVIVIISA